MGSFFLFTKLNVATSKFPSIYSIVKCTVSAFMLSFVSISNSLNGDSGSLSVYLTKKGLRVIVPQSGTEKEFRRNKFNKSKNSKKFDHEKYKSQKSNKTWDPDYRRTMMRKNFEKDNQKKPYHGFAPHAGLESLSIEFLKEQASFMGAHVPADIWSKLESVVFTTAALAECRSSTQAMSIILLYLKTHYNESLVEKAAAVFQDLFDEPSGNVDPHSGIEQPEWLTVLREGMLNWRLVTSNPVFKKISYLISILITLGLCDAASFEWKIGNVKAFSIPALEKHYGALDLVDAAIETVVYFVEGGYACFVSGSFVPLLYSDHQAREFDEEYSFLSSNLEHVKTGNLRKFAKLDDHEFDRRLNECIKLARDLSLSAKGTWEKKIFTDRLTRLRQMKTTFDSIRVQGGLRVAPFTVNFYGKSGVGKSSVSAISMVMGLLANGFGAEDEMMATLNESDKFMSNYRSFINGIFMDDVGNTKPDFVEKSPTNKIIEICNNVRQYANMAEADMKGKVSIEPKFVNLTTNVKNLCATVYSAEPVSIARRAHLTVTVEVKQQFCSSGMAGAVGQQLDSEKVAAFYTNEDGVVDIPVVPDLWELTVERVIPVPQSVGRDAIAYEIFEFEGKPLEKVDIHTYIKFMIEQSRKYFQQQERLVEQSNNLASKITMCSCGTPKGYCNCPEPHSGVVGYMFGAALGSITTKVVNAATSVLEKEGKYLEGMATERLLNFARDLESSPYYQWTNWIPSTWLKHKYARPFIHYALRDEIASTIRQESISMFCLGVACWIVTLFCPIFLILALYITYRAAVITRTVKERVYQEIVERNDAMPKVFKKVRENHAKYVLCALGAFGALYTLLKIWQGFRGASKQVHGNLQPTTQEEVAERDAEVNPWASVNVEDIPTNDLQQTQTPEHALVKVHKNQVFLRIKQYNGNRISGGVFIKSNVLLMPYHMWFVDAATSSPICEEMEVEIMRAPRELTGSVFKAYFSSNCMVRIPDTDFCVVWVPNGGSYRDIIPMLPIDKVKGGFSTMIFRDSQGGTVRANANVRPGLVGHSESQFMGGDYELSIPTFKGLCMGTFITRGKACVIAGFHLGGKTGTTTGVLGSLTQKQACDAITELAKKDTVVIGKSEGTMQTSLYGEDFFESKEVHKKSPVNFLEEGTNFRVFGSVQGTVSPHSNVTRTMISDTVAEVCGIPQQWGPPQFKPAWKPWQESLKYSSSPSIGVEGHLLEWAVNDYKAPLIKMLRDNAWIVDDIKPLNRMQTVCGIDGKRFIDKMPPKTSVGYPLSGPKSEYLTLLDPDEFPDQQFPVELDERFWDQFEYMQKCYLAGERAYPIFKGCLKDEPTKLSKDKVRVFQAAPIALQLMVRMYFLPIARFLSINPLISECAVGINSQGPEWHALQEHITKFGRDRILAGDYSKYDLRMPAQVMFAAFRIMIDIARESGNYSDDDISIMEGIATDICYPVMAYNGTLLQLIGSNPSGQNLTVYVNSIVNSLLNRCGFYHIMSNNKECILGKAVIEGRLNFRDVCALATYGDDVKGSVRKGCDPYNHISYAQFLAEHDMKFTMPDKESTPVEYMNDADADFLKRKNVWNEEVQMYFGALDEMSIFKSLHSTLRSKFLTDEEQAIENIDGALREWFAHGEEVYEMRRKQMAEIASRHGLVCRETGIPYAARMTAWKAKYLREDEQVTSD